MSKLAVTAGTVLCALALVTGCGGGSNSNTTQDSGATSASLAASTSEAAGGQVKLPKKTIGFVNVIAASETAGHNQQVAVKAAKLLGWNVVTCDGNGDPGKMAACEQSMVTRGVDAIVNLAISPSVVRVGAQQAQAKHIPVIGVGSQDPLVPPVYDALYGENDFALAALAAKYIDERLGPNGGQVAMLTSTGAFALSTASTLGQQMLTQYPNVKVVATHETNLASVGPDTQKAIGDILSAHPHVKAIWTIYDGAFPPAVETVKQRGLSDKVFVVGDYATPTNVKLLKAGKPAAALANTWSESTVWVALNQLASHFAKGTPIDPLAASDAPSPLALLTQKGLPPLDKSGFPKSPEDFRSMFINRWHQLYGTEQADPNSF